MLTDLGMSGRMSLGEAKAIKEKREFEQELSAYPANAASHALVFTDDVTGDVKEFATKMEAAGRRRAQKSSAAEEDPLEDSDVEIPPKRRVSQPLSHEYQIRSRVPSRSLQGRASWHS